ALERPRLYCRIVPATRRWRQPPRGTPTPGFTSSRRPSDMRSTVANLVPQLSLSLEGEESHGRCPVPSPEKFFERAQQGARLEELESKSRKESTREGRRQRALSDRDQSIIFGFRLALPDLCKTLFRALNDRPAVIAQVAQNGRDIDVDVDPQGPRHQ